MKTAIFKNPVVRNILSAVAVAGSGFVLLNAAFLLDFLFQSTVRRLIRIFVPVDPEMGFSWFPPLMHVSFAALIGLVSWPILRSKLSVLAKSIYLTVPLATVFVTIGIFLYRWPAVAFSVGISFGIGVLYYFHRTKKPWLYYYTLVLVGSVLAIMTILGVDI